MKIEVKQSKYGKAVFAKEVISTGEEILTEEAVISWSVTKTNSKLSSLIQSTITAFINAKKENISNFKKLSVADNEELQEYVDDIIKIYKEDSDIANDTDITISTNTNTYTIDTFYEDLRSFLLVCLTNAHFNTENCGLFLTASRMNHSCFPNTVFFLSENPTDKENSEYSESKENNHNSNKENNKTSSGRITFKANKDINPGEEVTCCYLRDYQLIYPLEFRRELLFREKYFMCFCERCIEESKEETINEISGTSPENLDILNNEFPFNVTQVEDLLKTGLTSHQLTQLSTLSQLNNSKPLVLKYLLLSSHYSKQVSLPPFIVIPNKLREKYILYTCLFYLHLLKDNNLNKASNCIPRIPKVFIGKFIVFGSEIACGVCELLNFGLNGIEFDFLSEHELKFLRSVIISCKSSSNCSGSLLLDEIIGVIMCSGGWECICALSKVIKFNKEIRGDLFYLKEMYREYKKVN